MFGDKTVDYGDLLAQQSVAGCDLFCPSERARGAGRLASAQTTPHNIAKSTFHDRDPTSLRTPDPTPPTTQVNTVSSLFQNNDKIYQRHKFG
jgi:hypothetical protein